MLLGTQVVVQMALWEVTDRLHMLARRRSSERGSVSVETAIIGAVFCLAALFVAWLLYDRVTARAETIDLEERPPVGGASG
jgi:hypothetical protein